MENDRDSTTALGVERLLLHHFSLFAVLSIESSMISQFLILLILLGVIQNCLSSEQVINVGDQISTSHNFNFTEREPSPL